MSTAITMVCLAVSVVASEPQKDALAQARQAYNAAQYDAAITAATAAVRINSQISQASVVLARAHLERFRHGADASDLTAARDAMSHVDIATLAPRDRVEFTLAQAESLYFDDRFGAAAETFELVLARVDLLGVNARDQILDWWAGAIDRDAQLGAESARSAAYSRILHRMEDELARNPVSPAATFWLADAAAGLDDGERAWSAAEAGWVRAGQMGAVTAKLRDDLDRLVKEAVIPIRVRAHGVTGDPSSAINAMRVAWEDFKAKWS